MKNTKIEKWIIKDADGEYITVKADTWEVGGNGLVFYRNGERVAHFARWSNYRKLNG